MLAIRRCWSSPPGARYGAGTSADSGRAWDSAAWFIAVYGGHYGLTMTPSALIVQPRPFKALPDDGVQDLTYQGARIQLALDAPHLRYRIQADRSIIVHLRPMGTATLVQVDGGMWQKEVSLVLQPGREYSVASERGPDSRAGSVLRSTKDTKDTKGKRDRFHNDVCLRGS
jgi:hypothetical protein